VARSPVTARNRHNIVLTGPPRSGTTMSVYLLHKSRNTVALDEPMQPSNKLCEEGRVSDRGSATQG
jgi:hypothetical protein